MLSADHIITFQERGCLTLESVFTKREIEQLLNLISNLEVEQAFGVRQFLNKYDELVPIIFNRNLKNIIHSISEKAIPIRSLYFDKPPSANWVVNWHQDLTIDLKEKGETQGFTKWRVLPERTVVQPPLNVLENMFTIRIHLDDCLATNGALRIVEGTHLERVIRIKEGINYWTKNEKICEVKKGGVLLMKPLLLHASKRTANNQNRRVIHMEFSDYQLPNNLEWNESINRR